MDIMFLLLSWSLLYFSAHGERVLNWNKLDACYPTTVVSPNTVQEVADLLGNSTYQRVRAYGKFHSFNQFACSVDLMFSTENLNQVVAFNTTKLTVTCQAGMTIREILQYLSSRGYTLPTFSYFIDQSIGGAIATDTHGSSTRLGTLSSLVRSVKIVLANGTITSISADEDQQLMRAVRVSLGFLGVVVEVELDIAVDEIVTRDIKIIQVPQILEVLSKAQANPLDVDEYNLFWYPQAQVFVQATIQRNQTAEGRIGGPLISRFLTSFFEIVYNTVSLFPLVKIVYFYVWAIFVRVVPSKWANLLTIWLQVLVQIPPGRFPFSEALPSQKNFITDSLNGAFQESPYLQFEFAISFELMESCVNELLNMITTDNRRYNLDALIPPLWRFVREEDSLLGTTQGGPRLYINFDAYFSGRLGLNQLYENSLESYRKILELMVSDVCRARLHLGKGGPISEILNTTLNGTWSSLDGAYFKHILPPNSWSNFNTIANSFDPNGKFADINHVLRN